MRTAQDVFAATDIMLANAIRYNNRGSVVHVAAERVKVVFEKMKRRKRERLAAAASSTRPVTASSRRVVTNA